MNSNAYEKIEKGIRYAFQYGIMDEDTHFKYMNRLQVAWENELAARHNGGRRGRCSDQDCGCHRPSRKPKS